MPLNEKDTGIAVQVAAKEATQLLAIAHRHDGEVSMTSLVDEYKAVFTELVDVVIGSIETQIAEREVQQAFPGTVATTTEPQGSDNVYRMPAQPAPIPMASSGDPKDALWTDLVNNRGGWYDNRGNKRNPKGPDFKRKSDGEGLWLDPKTPAWARQALGA